jgi:ABC-type multidrug transport system fused ATPase/permease subunit
MSERPVLKDLNFKIDLTPHSSTKQKNQSHPLTYAIAGRTGSGKSTLLYLLGRFYSPDSGIIKMGDINIDKMDYQYWRKKISYVFQETFLFDGTIKDNILYGNPHADEKDFLEASKCACVDDFIDQLSDGYQTRIGERGVTLSGGQKQRVGIARALLAQPKVLLLDDCTAFLDNRTEKKILQSIRELKQPITIIMVSHRPNSLLAADHILFLNNGQVIESGTPETLLNMHGAFNEMIQEINPEIHKSS